MVVQAREVAGVPAGPVRLPTVPMVVVRADTWTVYFAVPGAEGSRGTVVVGSVRLGETTSHLGAFKVVAGLRACYEWASGEFAGWFERALRGQS